MMFPFNDKSPGFAFRLSNDEAKKKFLGEVFSGYVFTWKPLGAGQTNQVTTGALPIILLGDAILLLEGTLATDPCSWHPDFELEAVDTDNRVVDLDSDNEDLFSSLLLPRAIEEFNTPEKKARKND